VNSLFTTQVSKIRPLLTYIKKQQENRRFVRAVEISATFTLITFFMFFAIKPTLLTISSLKGDIESKKILKAALKEKINKVILAQDLFSQVQEKYQIVNSSLPDRPAYYEAASQILKNGKDTNIQVDNLSFNLQDLESQKIDPNVQSYSVSVGVVGSFNSGLKLASELLKNRRIINISAVNFFNEIQLVESTGSATGGINTKFVSSFYYWPEHYGKK
jgi:hypothetical protein